jgi:CheY-like chemotaxis protein
VDASDCFAEWNTTTMAGVCSTMQKRLLIVDDDARLTRIVALTADTLDISTTQVNDPRRALDNFVRLRPQVLILDIFMPEQDGIDVLNEILLTGIPSKIVLTSGYSDAYLRLAEGVAKFHESGQVSILKKPFRRADLVALLTELAEGD